MKVSRAVPIILALLVGACSSFDFPWSTRQSEYTRGEVSDAQRQADLDACYSYAQAQIRHDQRVQQDIDAARSAPDRGLGMEEFTARLRSYGERNRFKTLFDSCMSSKGYGPE